MPTPKRGHVQHRQPPLQYLTGRSSRLHRSPTTGGALRAARRAPSDGTPVPEALATVASKREHPANGPLGAPGSDAPRRASDARQ
jgi:hypothetical protein